MPLSVHSFFNEIFIECSLCYQHETRFKHRIVTKTSIAQKEVDVQQILTNKSKTPEEETWAVSPAYATLGAKGDGCLSC